jgi:hypothetical protein
MRTDGLSQPCGRACSKGKEQSPFVLPTDDHELEGATRRLWQIFCCPPLARAQRRHDRASARSLERALQRARVRRSRRAWLPREIAIDKWRRPRQEYLLVVSARCQMTAARLKLGKQRWASASRSGCAQRRAQARRLRREQLLREIAIDEWQRLRQENLLVVSARRQTTAAHLKSGKQCQVSTSRSGRARQRTVGRRA